MFDVYYSILNTELQYFLIQIMLISVHASVHLGINSINMYFVM